ncbi:MAG: hypothetical protein Q8K20_04165 [Gemmobacter sp.]|nr:hypothetical protein [Gemmobacter sp.]
MRQTLVMQSNGGLLVRQRYPQEHRRLVVIAARPAATRARASSGLPADNAGKSFTLSTRAAMIG